MPFTIEPGATTDLDPCECCGGRTRVVRGFVYTSEGARAVYFVRWAPGRPQHGATVALSLGRWGGASASDRACFAFDHRVNDCPGFMVVDAGASPFAARSQLLGRMMTRAPKEYECTLRGRIGSLSPDTRDLWWEVDETTAFEELSADVVHAYERYGKPWFDKTGTLRGLIDATPPPPKELAAAGAFALGEHERARTLQSNAISGLGSDASTAERREQLRACVDRWGLRR